MAKEIIRLSEEDIVRYLFNSKIPKNGRLLIFDRVEELSMNTDID